MNKLATFAKALAAGVVAGAVALQGVWSDGVTAAEGGGVAAAAVAAFLAVYFVPNKSAPE